jgi:hypothetical protein
MASSFCSIVPNLPINNAVCPAPSIVDDRPAERRGFTVPANKNTVGHQSRDQPESTLPFPKGIWKGKVFAQLTIAGRSANYAPGKARMRCRCTCGNECVVRLDHLKRGHTKSCGCIQTAKGQYKNGEKQSILGSITALSTRDKALDIMGHLLRQVLCHKHYRQFRGEVGRTLPPLPEIGGLTE